MQSLRAYFPSFPFSLQIHMARWMQHHYYRIQDPVDRELPYIRCSLYMIVDSGAWRDVCTINRPDYRQLPATHHPNFQVLNGYEMVWW